MIGDRSDPDDTLDPSLEREVRDALRRLDPGPTPLGLRERVLDVPGGPPGRDSGGRRRGLSGVLGIAATVLVALVGLAAVGAIGRGTMTAAPPSAAESFPATPVAAASASMVPASPGRASTQVPGGMDLSVVSQGIHAQVATYPAQVLVTLALGVLFVLLLTLRGRRKVIPVAVASILGGYVVLVTQVPITIAEFYDAPWLNIRPAAAVPGSSETLWYEVAPRGEKFIVGLGIAADSALPVRLEGVVEPSDAYRQFYLGRQWDAVWIDDDTSGGVAGTVRRFAPQEVRFTGLWLVGHAGACAAGSSFDPAAASSVTTYAGGDGFDFEVTVLGWPRTVHLTPSFNLVEPLSDCPATDGSSPAPPLFVTPLPTAASPSPSAP